MFTHLRWIESALLGFIAFSVLWNYYLVIPAKASLVAHWLLEKPRWQLVPAYTAAILLAFLPLTANSAAYTWISVFIILLLLASATLAYLTPLFTLPTLSGPWKVGTVDIETVDGSRPMWVNDEDAQHRRFRAQLWYPTMDGDGPRAPYWPHLALRGPAAARDTGMPWYVFNHFNLIESRSFLGAHPLSQDSKPLPVIVFSHGYTGSPYQSTMLCEDLASHGFIVVAVEHTCDSTLTVFRDGSTVPFRGMEEFPEQDEKKRGYRRKQAGIRSRDLSHMIDLLSEMNLTSPLWKGKIDLDRIGVMGHSFGGCTAILTAYQDPRVRACVSLDGWLWPLPEFLIETETQDAKYEDKQHISRPIMLFDAPCFLGEREEYSKHNRKHGENLLKRSARDSFKGVVANSRHHDFCDVSFMAPKLTRLMDLTGFPDGYLMQKLMLDYVLAFFNETVAERTLGNAPTLDTVHKRYTQVVIQDPKSSVAAQGS